MAGKTTSATKNIRSTRNYRMFQRNTDNRILNLPKHKKLRDSMQEYGFLQSFPIVCSRNGDKHLHVKDGQHRLAFAEQLGLPVYFVEENVDFDVAKINSAAKVWEVKDYALKYAANGVAAYQEGLDFAQQHSLPIGVSFAMLGGTTTFSNIENAYVGGAFKIKDRKWADAVAGIYGPMVKLSGELRSARFLAACMAVCRIKDFDEKRLLQGAARCRDKLLSYSTRDAFLTMMEEVYNFGRSKLFGLKTAAAMATKNRSAIVKSVNRKKAKLAAKAS